MSELHLTNAETKGFPDRGPDAYLSQAEQAFVQRILSHPESFPKAFWSAVMQKVALDGEPIPQSQVTGLLQARPSVAVTILTSETTASTTYTNLATVGPEIENLSNGTYLVFISCVSANNTVGAVSFMSVESNGAGNASDAAILHQASTADYQVSGFTGMTFDLRNDNNNKLTAKYRVSSGTGTFLYRRMFALKVGN